MEKFTAFFSKSNANLNLLDPNEASANRMGELTPSQEQRLSSAVLGGGISKLAGPIIVFGVFFFILFTSLLSGSAGWFMLIPILVFGGILLASFNSVIDWFQLARKLKIDRDHKIIRSAVGELGFDRKKGYVVQAGEQTLRLPPSANAGGLLPGARYNCHYLPESGMVLSAEQLGTASSAQMRNALTGILAIANDFTLEDLQANQQNEISPNQRSRATRKILGGLVPLAIFVLFAGFGLFMFVSSGNEENIVPPFIFMAIIFMVFAAISGWGALNTFLDLNSAMPEMLNGVGTKISREKGSGKSRRTVYYYVIEGKEFEVSATAYNALINGQTYRIYYTPRANHLLSIESTGGDPSPFDY